MTAIFYPDREATSPDGRFTLEARSPHNGTIRHRNGRPATANEFAFNYRQNQSDFRYRLLDTHVSGNASPRVVWKRWQEKSKGEDSPHEVLVSDEGWSILRTHGFNPEVIAVSPAGHDTVRVRILGRTDEDEEREAPEPREGRRYVWRAEHLSHSTAGIFWSQHSWPYFFQADGTAFFAWRTYWGHRLVLDLEHAALLPEDGPARIAITRAMEDAEARGAQALLADLSTRLDQVQELLKRRASGARDEPPPPLLELIRRVPAAFHLVGVHRLQECLPLLRRWEALDVPSYSSGTSAMPSQWWLQAQYFRPILHHTLRRLGVEPQGFATYHFRTGDQQRFPVAEQVAHRREKAATLDPSLSAEQVLQHIGSPDHVRRRSHPVGTLYRTTEEWEYDFRVADQWVTLRLVWEEHRRQGRITSIQEVPAYWLQTDERVMEFFSI